MKLTKTFPVYALAALLACIVTFLPLAGLSGYPKWASAAEPEEKDFTPEFVAQCKSRAEAGESEGQALYARALFNGWGIEKDAAKAVEWWRKAAELGNVGAMSCLGACYIDGIGVEKDMVKAIEWYHKAAELGNAAAMFLLATSYFNGWGVEKDLAKADYWKAKAAKAAEAAAKADVSWAMRGKNASTNATADTPAAIEAEWKAAIENATRITTAPRMEGADAEKGEGLLEAFGTRYMPNAYAAYQKARETAKERELLLRENFPIGRSSDATGGSLYDKVAKNTAKAVAEMLRYHDELCHFFVLHRAGGVTDEQLSEIDSAKIAVRLPEESLAIGEGKGTVKAPTAEELTFAAKYLPEIHQANQTLRNDLDAKERDYAALRADAIAMDAVKTGDVFVTLYIQLLAIRGQIDGIATLLKEERLLHAVGERTSEQLANIDQKKSLAIREFHKTLPYSSWVENCYLEGLTASIPGKNYRMGRTEVTRSLWETVMGGNSSYSEGAENPVGGVSWNRCQEFLKRFNAFPEVRKSGLVFRLPTEKEWEYACRAGATGYYCKLADGTEITEDTLGRVAWFRGNSGSTTHPVGLKEPNAFGLYDMHGNVDEWTQSDGWEHVSRGGNWNCVARSCGSSWRFTNVPDFWSTSNGFRLCADVKTE